MGFRWRGSERALARRRHSPLPPMHCGGSDYTVSTLKNTNNDNNNKCVGHALRSGASVPSAVRGRGGGGGVQSLRTLTDARTLADIILY